MIGKVPNEITCADIKGYLETVELPIKEAIPEQNCVSWVKRAIDKLQAEGLSERFDIDHFMTVAIMFTDERIRSPKSTLTAINYTKRPM